MKPRRLSLLLFSLFFTASFLNAIAQDAKKPVLFSSDLGGMDMQFLVSATQQGILQGSLGELAATHAQSAEVKAFGQTLSKEHATQNEQLRLIAIKKGFALPENLNPQKNPIEENLAKLKGLKFDKAYMDQMVPQQQSYAAIFEQGSQSHDPDIKSFATSALPAIQRHLAFLKGTAGSAPRSAATPHFRINVGDPGAPEAGKN